MVPFTYTSSTSRIPPQINTRYSFGCSPTKPLETQTLPQLYDNNLNNITEEKKGIDDFLNSIKDIQRIPDENQGPKSGFHYAITLYQDGEDSFTFGPTHVNDHYYDTEPNMLPIMDDFYRNLEVNIE